MGQAIIQWYEPGKQRDQTHFGSANPGSHSLTPDALVLSHAGRFADGYTENDAHQAFRPSSYTFDARALAAARKLPAVTTDLFLYGHSTWRSFGDGPRRGFADVRGISIGGHYVSAAKMASYVDHVAGTTHRAGGEATRLRIWLLSCHSGDGSSMEHYSEHLARKLAARGWRDKRLISFVDTVMTSTLKACRDVAADHGLYAKLPLETIGRTPVLHVIDDAGVVTKLRGD
jgi:hypothetical protein